MSDDESSKNCTRCKLPLTRRERSCKRCGTKVVSRSPQFLTLAPANAPPASGFEEQVPVANGDFLSDDTGSVKADIMNEKLERILQTLSKRERDVLRMRFGLNDGRQRSLLEVGKHFGITPEKVRSIEAMALSALRTPLSQSPGTGKSPSNKRIPRKELVNVLNNFSAAEQEILKLKWGFANGRCHSAQEISELIGVTIEEIRQLEGQVFTPPEIL